MTIHTLYRRNPQLIQENASVYEALGSLLKNNISSLIIINNQQEPIGIISVVDIVKNIVPDEFQEHVEVAVAMHKHHFFAEMCEKVANKKVSDIMCREFITAKPDTHLMTIAADFLKNNLFIVPIVDNNKVIGVITRTEIITAIAGSLSITKK